ncbi:SMP-30/gluconolactonase/LRE family protein [Oecophyllibacter saccharovorans]|uniref:SMP-30/gluconolactonase/LRE family protein n=1 Tax=Oecophyllibacter saccharovorans TaxID=2558360 RepID=A0A506UQ39_9PROT|nr:SMP-30/gluconolactonase/LRE family protein [Oecophyllibacter saccharovorans]QDH15651.1 SMP-30/gluconolactonase/LRE family protein [Oecophyllibacter saccharovorans]TPW35426.1 SMP-30/gluconolactonase/LRE family protein [Oecophyllibacter saccharovorans]TPW36668.1 SMP-30/gluconolactonase/LRE family protein [Oecophyllibacter saccharovorans]
MTESELAGTGAASAPQCILDLKATLGEGPVWMAAENALYFTDIMGRKVHRFQLGTCKLTTWEAPAPVGFLLPVSSGGFLAGLPDGLHRFDPATGAFAHMCTVEPEQPDNRLNDGCVDEQGRIWFGTMDTAETSPSGAIYRVVARQNELEVSHWDEGYVVSNGPALSPDGKTLYVCNSPHQRIYAFDVDGAGKLSGKRVFATFEKGYPDGLVTDSEGTLWCGTWGGGQITRLRPDGSFLPPIALPVSNVTKVAFGGGDLRTVFVTTARKGLSEEQLAQEPLAGGLFSFQSEVAGLPQQFFQL